LFVLDFLSVSEDQNLYVAKQQSSEAAKKCKYMFIFSLLFSSLLFSSLLFLLLSLLLGCFASQRFSDFRV